jgi:hypothetical protein
LRRATGHVDPLQLPIREKSNGPAVGRPEWKRRSVSVNRRRCRRRQGPQIRFLCDDEREGVGDILTVECALSGQHFIEHAPEGPHIRPLINRLPFCLLGAHIGRGAEDDTGVRDHGRRRDRGGDRKIRSYCVASERLGKPEIKHFHGAVCTQLDIGRLEIAMDDVLLVRGFEGSGNLPCDRERFIEWNGTLHDPICERGTFDKFQYKCPRVTSLFEAIDVRDIGVVQRGEHCASR